MPSPHDELVEDEELTAALEAEAARMARHALLRRALTRVSLLVFVGLMALVMFLLVGSSLQRREL